MQTQIGLATAQNEPTSDDWRETCLPPVGHSTTARLCRPRHRLDNNEHLSSRRRRRRHRRHLSHHHRWRAANADFYRPALFNQPAETVVLGQQKADEQLDTQQVVNLLLPFA